MQRIVRRTVLSYGRTRPDMAAGCPERFDLEFLRFAWRYTSNGRCKALRLIEDCPDAVTISVLRKPNEVNRFLGGCVQA